jgi:hypothetical protein
MSALSGRRNVYQPRLPRTIDTAEATSVGEH